MKEYYTKAEYEQAQNGNVIDYLDSMGYELVKEGGHFYRGKLHDSLVINGSNGKWKWNSKDLSGNLPVELLKQILIYDYGYDDKSAYIKAIKRLAGTEGQNLEPDNNVSQSGASSLKPKTKPQATPEPKGELVMPEKNDNYNRAIAYLCKGRNIDYDIVKKLILQKKIFETKDRHNVAFVSYDKENRPRHVFMRGTLTHTARGFKKDLEHSDKSYPFILQGDKNATKVYCFESSIDAMSHATLYKMNGRDYQDGYRIALHGTSFMGLETFLNDNPDIKEIVACLDNDEAGLKRGQKMCKEFHDKGYKTFMQPPNEKDYNEQLQTFIHGKKNLNSGLSNEADLELSL